MGGIVMINLIGRRFTQITTETKKDAMRIALSAKRLSVYIRVQKGNSNTIKLSFRRKKFTPPPQKKEVVMATP